MKKVWKKWCIAGLAAAILMAATGCGEKSDSEDSSQDTVTEVVYPVSIDGTEILIGETTVQALLDSGLRITVSEMSSDFQITQYEIDPELQLESRTYYSGSSVWLSDSSFAHISMVTGGIPVKMKDAVIAYMEFSPSSGDSENMSKILFNGIPITELTREKAGEIFPDFTGDEFMWFSPVSMREYKYFMSFDWDGALTKFSVERKYDVDWNS